MPLKLHATGPTGRDNRTSGFMPLAIVTGTTPVINWVHSHHNAKPILLTNSTGAMVAYTGHAVLGRASSGNLDRCYKWMDCPDAA